MLGWHDYVSFDVLPGMQPCGSKAIELYPITVYYIFTCGISELINLLKMYILYFTSDDNRNFFFTEFATCLLKWRRSYGLFIIMQLDDTWKLRCLHNWSGFLRGYCPIQLDSTSFDGLCCMAHRKWRWRHQDMAPTILLQSPAQLQQVIYEALSSMFIVLHKCHYIQFIFHDWDIIFWYSSECKAQMKHVTIFCPTREA